MCKMGVGHQLMLYNTWMLWGRYVRHIRLKHVVVRRWQVAEVDCAFDALPVSRPTPQGPRALTLTFSPYAGLC
jgi:hypothetical protein